MNKNFIPVCEPSIGSLEREYLLEAFDSGWISSGGPFNKKLEEQFSKYCDAKYGVSVSNGTTAIHLAIKALGLKKGDEVIVPNFNGIYAIYALLYEGIIPIFVDSEKETWNICPKKIEEKITNKTKALLLVHIFGHPCEMDTITEIAENFNLKIIEDAAEAHGAEYKNKKVGGIGHISTFSFFANKIITSGEGGIIVTNNKYLSDQCEYYRNQCFSLKGPRDFIHKDIGHNYRLTNLQASIALAQFKQINKFIKQRIQINKEYKKRLGDIESIIFQPEADWAKNVFWMTCFTLDADDNGQKRQELEKYLLENNIQTRRLFVGMNKQPIIKKLGLSTSETFSVTDKISDNGLYIPSTSHLSIDKIDYISEKIRSFIKKY